MAACRRGFAPTTEGFLHWLAKRHHAVDYLADDDFERIRDGDRLARLYDLVMFPGHEEYVTAHAHDVLDRFRDLGGNLAFLSANNVFYRVERRGKWLIRTRRWRDLGRPEAALVGDQLVGWNENRYPERAVRRDREAARAVALRRHWPPERRPFRLVRDRDRRAHFGVAARDAHPRADPRRVRAGTVCRDDLLHDPRGAKVFAAGAFTLGGAALWPSVSPLLDNLWRELSSP